MRLKSWGLIEAEAREPLRLSNRLSACEAVREGGFSVDCPATIHAGGRSYSDIALPSARSRAILTSSMRSVVSFCRQTGVLEIEAGATLAQIQALALPAGWGLPVIPGTAKATVGGALANDVHGKNHGARGSFSRSVIRVSLLRSDVGRIEVDRSSADLWAATVGGLGATGLMLTLTLQLTSWPSRHFVFSQTRFSGMQEFFRLSADAGEEHVVGWIDALSSPARGVLFKGDPAPADALGCDERMGLVKSLPLPTAKLITAASSRAFNWLYWRTHADQSGLVSSWESFFCPLDNLNGWNRLYGAGGLSQFQCVVPVERAADGFEEMFKRCRRHGQGSFLAVVKVFGDMPSEGWMSFARSGVTFAMDFANVGSTPKLLAELSAIAMECGGALYPAKMQFATPQELDLSFPNWPRWRGLWDEAYGNAGALWMARNIREKGAARQGDSNER